MTRRGLPAVVLVAALFCAPGTASANDDGLDTLFIVSSSVVLAADLGFLLADLGFGVEGDWLPPAAAWTELVLMTAANYAMGIITIDRLHDTAGDALGAGELVVGTWLAIHGILSILGQPDEPPDPVRASLRLAPRPEGGAEASMVGTF